MNHDLINQTAIAAEMARQNGFEGTHRALLEMLKQLKEIEIDVRTPTANLDS